MYAALRDHGHPPVVTFQTEEQVSRDFPATYALPIDSLPLEYKYRDAGHRVDDTDRAGEVPLIPS